MEKYSYEKKPAFFRCFCASMFFEAEAGNDGIIEDLNAGLKFNPELDSELDAILGLQEVR